jgi:CRISPR-associated protein Csd1
MILQELVKYYERKLEEGEMAPEGFEYKEIPYLIEIDEEGNFVRFISTWIDEKKKRAKMFLIPRDVGRTSGNEANFLWDNGNYVLGIPDPKKPNISQEKINQRKALFYKKILEFNRNTKILDSIVKFSNLKFDSIKSDPLWEEISATCPNLTFKLKDHNEAISENKEVFNTILSNANENMEEKEESLYGLCLVTGSIDEIARKHNPIKGVRGAQSTGGAIVSFNNDAYESYGKEQSYNAPVSKKIVTAYTTSLNTLLSKDSHQKIQIGDATTIFWSEKKSDIEELFGGLFETSEKDRKDKDKQDIVHIKEHFVSPFSGKYRSLLQEETKFFVLGLSPNAARISIRFWYPTTVGEVSRNIEQHFQDLKMEIPNNESGFLSLYRILCSTAVQGKYDNVNPLLAGKIMTSILNGSEYPRMLLSSLLIRIKAEQRINFERISLIKAILNRKGRLDENFRNEYNFKEFKTSMDESNTNVAYRLGRLFAVMEKLQQNAIGGNKTIKDGYFASASTRPATVFARLFTLSNHHASKLGNKSIWYEKMKGEIIAPLKANIPKTFKLEEQGMFAIGYYQQREELFKKKEDNGNEGEQK